MRSVHAQCISERRWLECLLFSFLLKIAMGQGQMEITLALLKTCSTEGSWLCLKNLHLVTPWLSTLEKVLGIRIISRLTSALSSVKPRN
jgi:hypothetical protein